MTFLHFWIVAVTITALSMTSCSGAMPRPPMGVGSTGDDIDHPWKWNSKKAKSLAHRCGHKASTERTPDAYSVTYRTCIRAGLSVHAEEILASLEQGVWRGNLRSFDYVTKVTTLFGAAMAGLLDWDIVDVVPASLAETPNDAGTKLELLQE